jgi:pilus assembly protein CpaF
MSGHELPDRAIREQVCSALDLMIHVSRMSDGTRKMLSIQELVGMEGPVVTMQEIFRFVPTGQEENGKIRGNFEATGMVPRCLDRLRLAGIQLSPAIFERGRRQSRAA